METSQYKVYFRAQLAPVTVSTLFVRRTSAVKASAVPQITVLRTQWPSTFLDKSITDSLSGTCQVYANNPAAAILTLVRR